jgi:hypothetical protein
MSKHMYAVPSGLFFAPHPSHRLDSPFTLPQADQYHAQLAPAEEAAAQLTAQVAAQDKELLSRQSALSATQRAASDKEAAVRRLQVRLKRWQGWLGWCVVDLRMPEPDNGVHLFLAFSCPALCTLYNTSHRSAYVTRGSDLPPW